MSKKLQLRRGSALDHSNFTGAIGEVTVVTDDLSLRVHDGVTPGGHSVRGSGGSGTGDYTAGITVVSTLPVDGIEDQVVFNSTDQMLYIYVNGQWVDIKSEFTPDASVTVGIVSDLPASGVENQVIFNTLDNKLYKYVNGSWIEVVQAIEVAQTVADGSITTAKFATGITPVEVVDVLPTTGLFVGRTVYLTTDGKLYRSNGSIFTAAVATGDLTGTIGSSQLAANAVIAGKIAAGAISATEIAAGAINTDKLAAGAITTDKLAVNSIAAGNIQTGAITSTKVAANAILAGNIQAGAVGATQLAAGAITTDKLAANAVYANNIAAGAITSTQLATGAVTATKIATGAITVDKISSGTSTIASGQIFGLGQGANAFGLPGTIVANNTAAAIGVLSVGGSTSFNTLAMCGVGCSSLPDYYALAGGNAYNTSYNSWRTYGLIGAANCAGLFLNSISSYVTQLCTTSYGVYTTGPIGPFTGQHDALLDKTEILVEGDIVVDTGFSINSDIMNSICKVSKSSSANQKGVVGVYVKEADAKHVPVSLSTPIVSQSGISSLQINPEYLPLLTTNKLIVFNAVGEGLINVCGEGGSIEVGDLIVSSSLAGKGMKQQDDIVRSITIAKARESITFSSPSEVKQVACIYLAG